jgi:hypothetical protein
MKGMESAMPDDPKKAPEQPEGSQGEAAHASLAVIINSLATQVFVSLGIVENPLSKSKQKDLLSARFTIDLLQVLGEKTKGNLTPMEDRYLQGVLHELRMHYLEAARQPEKGPDAAPKP